MSVRRNRLVAYTPSIGRCACRTSFVASLAPASDEAAADDRRRPGDGGGDVVRYGDGGGSGVTDCAAKSINCTDQRFRIAPIALRKRATFTVVGVATVRDRMKDASS